MQQDFQGGIYWDELAETSSDISGVEDFEVWRDFEEICTILYIS